MKPRPWWLGTEHEAWMLRHYASAPRSPKPSLEQLDEDGSLWG